MATGKNYQLKHVLYAYHEAGHAVVWHIVNGLIEAVSIDADQAGYKGYCRFGFLLCTEDGPFDSDIAWPSSGRIHPRTVTAYYAGMLAMAYYCCAGYLAYPFQHQEVNSHEEDSITPNLMRECKEKELVKPSSSLFWNGYAK